jgi:N-acetylglucosaminyldiphosphoundecaprenol N-acetyl-beta-D-mannosaminyltransferase
MVAAHFENIVNNILTSNQQRESDAVNQGIDSVKALEKRLSGRSSGLKSIVKRTLFRLSATTAGALERGIEITATLVVTLTVTVPLLLILLFRKLFTGTTIFTSKTIAGAGSMPIRVHQFNNIGAPWCDLPLFFEVLTGRLALVGTAIKEWSHSGATPEKGYINMMKPGIISLWDVRQSSKIAHEGQLSIEWEYIFKKHLFYDFMLLLRALPAMLYSEKNKTSSSIFRLLDIDLRNLSMVEAVTLIGANLAQKKQCTIFFANPDCFNKMISDRDYFNILKTGDYIFPDGIGLVIAGKMLQTPLKENINGTDMLPYICRMAASTGHSIYLLGGKPGIAEQAGQKISATYGVPLAGTAHGYFDHQTESDAVIEAINNSGAAILLVGFGAPLQEKWISNHRHQLKAEVLMGVGGLFDFYSGTIRRAPSWIREIGFEWIYRMLQEPGRMWRRYVVGNPLFLYRVVKWKVFSHEIESIHANEIAVKPHGA